MHVLVVEDSVFATQDNLVPQHHLVQLILIRLILGSQVEEQLLDIPVEQGRQVRTQVERDVAQVPFLTRGTIVGNIFPAKLGIRLHYYECWASERSLAGLTQ